MGPRSAFLACFGVALLFASPCVGARPAQVANAKPRWITAFGRTLQWPSPGEQGPELGGRTFRYAATLAASAGQIRVRLSNELPEFRDEFLVIGSASIAAADAPRDVHPLTFSGQASIRIPPGAPVVSDPVALKLRPRQKVIISLYFPQRFQPLASDSALSVAGLWGEGADRSNALITEPGDQTLNLDAPGKPIAKNPIVTGVEVVPAEPGWRSVIVLGTSRAASLDSWPYRLADRAATQKIAVASISQIAGGMYAAVYGQTELARFDRDVLARPNVDWVILQTAGDDIIQAGIRMLHSGVGGSRTSASVEDLDALVSGYSQLITRAHEHFIRVAGITIHPWRGAIYDTNPERNHRRLQFIDWQLNAAPLDRVIDGVTPLADPETLRSDNPALARKYATGDGRTMSAAGDQAFADSIDLSIFLDRSR
jgi:hypothetical protein